MLLFTNLILGFYNYGYFKMTYLYYRKLCMKIILKEF